MTLVELIKFIFTLSLTESRAIYKMRRDGAEGRIVSDLAQMGLIEVVP